MNDKMLSLEDIRDKVPITTDKAAEILGVTKNGVAQAIYRKTLEATKVGRDWVINPASLYNYYLRQRSREEEKQAR